MNKLFLISYRNDVREARDGTLYYCEFYIDGKLTGEVATRHSAIAAQEIATKRAREVRKQLVYANLPHYQVRAGYISFTATRELMGNMPWFTAIGRDMLETYINTYLISCELADADLTEKYLGRRKSLSTPYISVKVAPEPEPSGFFHWLKSLFN